MTACEHRLSIVVIGRNDAPNLLRCLESVESLSLDREHYEVIYVDSASTDSSPEVAEPYVDVLVELKEHPALCAAAGRYHGTLMAHSPWILYLDSDMEFESAFDVELPHLLRSSATGCVGLLTDVHPDGAITQNAKGYRLDQQWAPSFGGAVLLSRSAVIDAGNWDPRIASNEEIDLHVRLRASGGRVRLVDTPMARHLAPGSKGISERARAALFGSTPRRGCGFGQVLRANTQRGQLHQLIKYFPEPFLVWTGLLTVLTGAIRQTAATVAGGAGLLAVAAVRRSPKFVVVAAALMVHAIRGWGSLPETWADRQRVLVLEPCPGRQL